MPNSPRVSSHRPDPQRHHWGRLRRLRAGITTPRQWRPARATRVLAPLVFVALILLIGRRYVIQRFDIEATVRHQLIPQLEKQLGTSIEVGRIESDWLSRVILHDIVIGRDEKLPLGALLRTKTAVLNLDIISLALHRTDALGALTKATLYSPQLYLERNSRGQLNWMNLFKKRFKPGGAQWAGLLEVRDGRVWYRDETIHSASGRILLADATGVNGAVRFNGSAPLTFGGKVARALIGPQQVPLYNLAAKGSAQSTGQWLAADATWPSAPAALLADYAFRRGEVVARSGSIGGKAKILFDAAAPAPERWLLAGDVSLNSVSGYAQAVKEPGSAQPLLLERVSGPVAFNNRTFSTPGLVLAALNSPLHVAGKFALLGRATTNPTRPEQPVFDLTLTSNSADTTRLVHLIQNRLKDMTLSGGRASGTVRVTGDLNSARVNANVIVPRFALRDPRYGSLSTALLRAIVQADGNATTGHIQADLKTSGVIAQHPQWGHWRASALHSVVAAQGSTLAGNLQVRLAAPGFSGAPPGGGTWKAQLLRGIVRADGSFQSPQLRADLTAPGLSVRDPNWGEGNADSLHAVAVAQGNAGAARFRVALTAPGVDARLPRWGTARVELLNGTVEGSGALRSPRIASNVRLTGFRLRSPRYGQARGQALRVVASSNSAVSSPWQGETRFEDVDVSALNLAAVAPGIAHRVRDVGTVDGGVRFAGLQSGNTPVVRGAVRLSHTTIEGVRLRDLTTQVSLSQHQLRLANGRAQSEFGLLLADAETNLESNKTAFAFTAPNVIVDAGQINPYLIKQGLALNGTARGRVSLATDSTTPGLFHARFALNSPLGWVQFLDQAGRSRGAIKARAPRLEGKGAVRFTSNASWQFVGDASVAAESASFGSGGQYSHPLERVSLAAPALPLLPFLTGSRSSAVRLAVSGSIAHTAHGMEPRLAGKASIAQIIVPNPASAARIVSYKTTPDRWLPLLNTSAEFVVRPHRVEIPRLFTHLRDDFGGGKMSGHVTLQRNPASKLLVVGQLLADKIDTARLARAIPQDAIRTAKPTGTAAARADFEGTLQNLRASIQTRLYNGSIRVKGKTLPIDAARADVELQLPDWQTIPLRELVVWSRGGRVALNGTISQAGSTPTVDLEAKINDVRLRDVEATIINTATLTSTEKNSNDGLVSGEFLVNGPINRPRVTGRVAVRLAEAAGLNIEEATAQLIFEQTADGPRMTVSEVAGTAEGTPFSGALEVDAARNYWNAKFAANGIGTERLLDVAAEHSQRGKALRDLRLHGTLRADVDISGTLEDAAGRLSLMPQTGKIDLDAAALRWRGRALGTVTARLALKEGVLQTKTLELRRDDPTATNAGANVALVSVTGDLPISLDAPELDAKISVDNERLSYVLETLTEIQHSLSERGEKINMLNRVLKVVKNMPPGLDARLALDAQLSGQWRRPRIAVNRLSVIDTRARLGGGKRLPTLEASFIYDNGFVAVQSAELRLAANDPEHEDTLLRIAEGGRVVPGGEVSLTAEVFNANLSLVAPWVSALQDANGQPLLHGELSQFTFRVTGTMDNPEVEGSILGEDIVFQNYNLDRLRLAQFSIKNGELRIEPNDLTVVKGSFQSSAAFGHVPWSWGQDGGAIGPRFNAPLEVHLPLQRRDFGALAGVFVPALSNAAAEDFSGSIDVTGTLNNPRVGGEVTIKDGRFRLNPAAVAFDAGVTGLSGTVRFVNGNALQIDPANILRGRIVSAAAVEAPSTGNLPAAQRNPRAAQRSERSASENAPKIAGAFTLRGDVRLDLDPQNLIRMWENISAHRYNLLLSVDDGAYATDDFSGFRDVTAGVLWRTATDENRQVQNVRWMVSARGGKAGRTGKGKSSTQGSGQLLSFASVNLAPGFATNVETLLRSQVESFSGAENFQDLGVFAKFAALQPVASLQGKPSQIDLHSFPISMRNAGRGALDGTLILDNKATTVPAPRTLPEVRPALTEAWRRQPEKFEIQTTPPTPTGGRPPVRIAGELTLSQAELMGAPVGGTIGSAFDFPDVPIFDIRILLGRNVQISVPNLHAEITGDMTLTGSPRDPLLIGAFDTRSGQARFPNAQARITNGSVTVAARRDPFTQELRVRVEVDTTARSRVGRYDITLHMQGPLDTGAQIAQNLRIDVTSNPPLSQDEAFAQLLGTANLEEVLRGGQGNDAYARAIVNLFSAPVFSGIERSLERALGLSSVAFEYRLNEPLGVEFGKAIGSHAYITYRRSITRNQPGVPDPYSLSIEYSIKGNVKLGVQTDERQRKQITIEKTWRF